MKLTEQRLKQIIKEEVIKKLLEQDDFEDYKKMTRRDLLKKGATAAGALAGIGGVSGLLKYYTDTDKEARAASRQDAAIEAYQKAYSLEEKIDDFNEYLNNVAAFRWGRGQESMMQIPGSAVDVDGIPRGITVLPPIVTNLTEPPNMVLQPIRLVLQKMLVAKVLPKVWNISLMNLASKIIWTLIKYLIWFQASEDCRHKD